ncbi:thioredoxin TrxA [Woodsholea maritima]|uniref:thioredoxin TrxA n=1 Tax=Woodsholea maritima TaxID=240237 RepID=UPI00037963B3|nr:thioredoxin TrxA [Woodsholea maritima]
MAIKTVSDDTFDSDVLKADGPILVDFWAEWCGPCKQIAPALDNIASDMEGKLTIAKVNIDDNPMTPGKYGVRGIPTMIIFNKGEIVDTKVGAMAQGKIQEWINTHVA